MKKTSKYIKIGLGIFITIFLLWYTLREISFEEVIHKISNADYTTLPLILIILYVFYLVKLIRWKYLLLPIREFSIKELAAPMWIGFLGNNLLPLRMGEIVRVLIFSRQFKDVSKGAVLSTIVLERIMDVFAIVFLLAIGIIVSPNLPEWCKSAGYVMGILSIIMLFLLLIYVKWTEKVISIFEKYFTFLPKKLFNGISQAIEKSAQGLHSLKDTRLLIINGILSIVEWVLISSTIHLSLLAFDVHLPLSASFVVNGITSFGVALPSSPGFFGVVEAVFSKSLALFKVPHVNAVSIAIYFHLINYFFVNIIGFYYLNRTGLSLTEVNKVAEKEVEQTEQ